MSVFTDDWLQNPDVLWNNYTSKLPIIHVALHTVIITVYLPPLNRPQSPPQSVTHKCELLRRCTFISPSCNPQPNIYVAYNDVSTPKSNARLQTTYEIGIVDSNIAYFGAFPYAFRRTPHRGCRRNVWDIKWNKNTCTDKPKMKQYSKSLHLLTFWRLTTHIWVAPHR